MNNQRTPSKNNVFPGFSPVLLLQSPVTSPQKNLTGHPRIVRDIVADLYNNIQKWNNLHIQGSQIVKQIAIMKSESLGCYSPELEQQTNDLYMTMQNIDSYVKVLEKLNNQINALVKLQTRKEVLFLSCSLQEIMQYIEIITNAYFKEYKVKQMVLENIAHARNEDEVMFFAACWTLQPYITRIVNLKLEALLIETGHRPYQ